METSFEIFISYSQIALFEDSVENPFNDWSDRHVAQGFAWRDESVSFKTLEESGKCIVTVCFENDIIIDNAATRVILVPFTVHKSGCCEIASISDSQVLKIKAGDYGLLYQTGYNDDDTMWIRFSFIPRRTVTPQVIRADKELSPKEPLLMEAFPA